MKFPLQRVWKIVFPRLPAIVALDKLSLNILSKSEMSEQTLKVIWTYLLNLVYDESKDSYKSEMSSLLVG